MRFLPLLFALLLSGCAVSPQPALAQMKLVSPNGVALFLQSEKVRFGIENAPQNALRYSVQEVDGSLEKSGDLSAQNGAATLPLDLPRGLYDLSVSAGDASVKTRFGIVFEPPAVSENSRWGIFSIRFDKPERDAEMARGHRLLGASWARYNLWADAFENVVVENPDAPDAKLSFDLNAGYVSGARALKKEGLHLMGEFSMMPRALSSRPDDTSNTIEGSPGWSRVAPQNYALWAQLVEKTVRELPEIEVWEVWNEPNIRNFWIDTPKSFARYVIETSRAIKRANPKARVAVAGITSHGDAFLEALLKAGVDKETDIWSFHASPETFAPLLQKYGVSAQKPRWETETHALGDLDVIAGYDKHFHFLYRAFAPAYDGFPALFDRAGAPTPAALTYATSVQVLGDDAKLVTHRVEAGAEVGTFSKGAQAVAVWKLAGAGLLDGQVSFQIAPMPGRQLEWLDGYGRAQTLPALNADGTRTFPIQGFNFLRGAAKIELVKFQAPREPAGPEEFYFSATSGKHSGWKELAPGEGFDPKNAAQKPSLFLSQTDPPDGQDWELEIPFEAPRDEEYQLLFLGLTLHALEADARWASPFAWSINGGAETIVDGTMPAYTRFSGAKHAKNQRINLEETKFTGNGDAYWELGRVPLKAGKHTFKMRILEARPDGNWVQNIEALGLRSAQGLPAFDAPKRAPAPVIPPPLPIPTLQLREGEAPIVGEIVALTNADFEAKAAGDIEKLEPPDWKRELGKFTYCGPYASKSGEQSVAFFPDRLQTQTLIQTVSRAQIEAALGRPMRAGDVLTLGVWARHYWEESGVAPKVVALGIGRAGDVTFAGKTEPLTREWTRLSFAYALTDADVADAGDWKIVLRADAARGKSMMLWDDVSFSAAGAA